MASRMRLVSFLLWIGVIAAILVGGWWVIRQWQDPAASAQVDEDEHAAHADDGSVPVKISAQARKNLGLVSKPLALTTYWRTLDLPGVIVDRPGISDRGVVAPITGVVTQIHAFPGNSVPPNAPLFSIRLVSESLHASQLELFKATKEIEIARRQLARLAEIAQSGALAQSRIIEIENQIERLEVTVEAYRQDLQSRGLPADRIEAAARGEFVTELVVRAPGEASLETTEAVLATNIAEQSTNVAEQPTNVTEQPAEIPFTFEMQALNVELGQQVEAGQVLCYLADHRALQIEGRGFKDDMPWLQAAAKNGWPIEVDIDDAGPGDWPPLPDSLQIQYVANVVDRESRTFAFYLELENQWHAYRQDGETRLVWRFRPGTRVRLQVPVEKFENVFVVPQQAVVREGPATYVFRQNGDLFDRMEVHVLHEDRQFAVVANDGRLRPGFYIAQNAAASLNRVLKAQAASGQPAGVHVHPDGTVHGAH